jgi:dipeptidyl aminopeptidase/acylaminoacyl peptidase
VPITREPAEPASVRYADMCVSSDGRRVYCVRETHGEGEARNEIVVLPSDGAAEPRVVASGRDFYAFPRLSPDGSKLAWTCWDHPNMPWDGTELWVADANGGEAHKVAGGREESIFQPAWSADGRLHWVSDKGGWWQLYREGERLVDLEVEFGTAQWVFGLSTYSFLDDGRVVCLYSRDGFDHIGIIEGGRLEEIELPYTSIGPTLQVARSRLVFIGTSAAEAATLVSFDVASGRTDVLRRSFEQELGGGCISAPQPVEFPSDGGKSAHALFYSPANADYTAPSGDLPPLLVLSHGGPTSMARAGFDPAIQFWTSRGFAVADVNYGGSTGYGREYRRRLNGQWGVVDVADCVNAARHLAESGHVDGKRLAIRGGSAGGYTTLCALTFYEDFAAGASYYGVADCETLATDTHKFESRYLDSLIGPYPETREVYRQRSPIHFTDRLSSPMILFQGLEDKIVPPSQAEAMVEALRRKGLPFAYLAFEGEQHGFRKAETVQRTLEAELYFYSRVFGFEAADAAANLEFGIWNLEGRG